MCTSTINLPDSMNLNQERHFLATNWYQAGKLKAAQAVEVAGLSVSTFLVMNDHRHKRTACCNKWPGR